MTVPSILSIDGIYVQILQLLSYGKKLIARTSPGIIFCESRAVIRMMKLGSGD